MHCLKSEVYTLILLKWVNLNTVPTDYLLKLLIGSLRNNNTPQCHNHGFLEYSPVPCSSRCLFMINPPTQKPNRSSERESKPVRVSVLEALPLYCYHASVFKSYGPATENETNSDKKLSALYITKIYTLHNKRWEGVREELISGRS